MFCGGLNATMTSHICEKFTKEVDMRYEDFDENRDEYLYREVEKNEGWRLFKFYNGEFTIWKVVDENGETQYIYRKQLEDDDNT